MFVLDFIDHEGNVVERYKPLDGKADGYGHSRTARIVARREAAERRQHVLVSRVVNGKARPAYVVRVDGSSAPPTTMQAPGREDCKRAEGVPCFCTPCRAERKAARATA